MKIIIPYNREYYRDFVLSRLDYLFKVTYFQAVERKVDRVSQQVLERAHRRASRNDASRTEANALRTSGSVEAQGNTSAAAAAASASTASGEVPGKIVIRCQAPRAMDELLRDVAAKVNEKHEYSVDFQVRIFSLVFYK